MSDMLEKLARAVLNTSGGGSIDDPFDGEYAQAVVRAILQELREPTGDMLAAGREAKDAFGSIWVGGADDTGSSWRARVVWQAMLESILSEPPQ